MDRSFSIAVCYMGIMWKSNNLMENFQITENYESFPIKILP